MYIRIKRLKDNIHQKDDRKTDELEALSLKLRILKTTKINTAN